MLRKLLFTLLLSISFMSFYAQGPGIVCVEVFNDLNGDGLQTDNEPGIEGIGFIIIAAPPSFVYPLPYYMATDETGNYCFTGLDYGTYTFQVEVPEGWQLTGSASPFFTVDIVESDLPNSFRFGLSSTMAAPQHQLLHPKVYPNPASSVLNIQSPGSEGGEVIVYDLTGKHLLSKKLTGGTAAINVSSLLPGIYVVQHKWGNRSGTTKFIVE